MDFTVRVKDDDGGDSKVKKKKEKLARERPQRTFIQSIKPEE